MVELTYARLDRYIERRYIECMKNDMRNTVRCSEGCGKTVRAPSGEVSMCTACVAAVYGMTRLQVTESRIELARAGRS